MQARAPTVERHTHLAAGQASQFVECACLGDIAIGGRQDANAGCHSSVRSPRGDLLQHVLQLAYAGHCDEAHQDVDPVD
jgi:hypothetical protein